MKKNKKSFVLIAEDDPDDRYLLESALKDSNIFEGFKFIENGVLIMEHLNTLKLQKENNPLPDLILLDLNMPKKDGREVLKEIKSDTILRQIPVVVFTTTKNENEISRCYEMGANSYIVKPVSYHELIKVLKAIWEYWTEISTPPINN